MHRERERERERESRANGESRMGMGMANRETSPRAGAACQSSRSGVESDWAMSMKKRSLIEPAVEDLPKRLELLLAVAKKALALGTPFEAERLIATPAEDYARLAEVACTATAREELARMRELLEPVLRDLEARTGKPWTRYLDAPPNRPWPGPRGQA
jgi:hypothetical protein